MNILSLFDGISCARVALERAGIPVDAYYASEVDKYAIVVSEKNYPNTVQLGDVKNISWEQYRNKRFFNVKGTCPDIDLLIGGSPCQDLSIAKAGRKGLDGERSGLFWEYVRILEEVKPRFFILENVASMPKAAMEEITKALGVEPVMINASLVSAQNRKRLFWVGGYVKDLGKYLPVSIPQPQDRGILLSDILLSGETHDLKSLCITATYHKKNARDFTKKSSGQMIQIGNIGTNAQAHRVYSQYGKSVTLSALGGGQGAKTGLYITQRPRGKNNGNDHLTKSPTVTSSSFEDNNHVSDGEMLRKLHPVECERLQGLPDNYTEGVSNTQRYKCIGNAFNVDVIAHILSFIKKTL